MECSCKRNNVEDKHSCKHYNYKNKCNLEEDQYEGWLDSLYNDFDPYDDKPNDFSDI